MKKGWEEKKLGEVCNLMTGGTPSRSNPEYFINGKIKWLVSGDIHKTEIFDCDGRITEEGMENSNAKYLPVNSVIIALNGQGKTRGTVAILRTKATCNQSLVSISPKNVKELLPEYIFCNLHGRYEEIRRITGDDGNDRRGLNMLLIRNIEIPLPPLPEQKRIVGILDEAFVALEKAKANAEKNLQNTRELFESYLQDIFANPGDGWEEKKLGEVCEVLDKKRKPITKRDRTAGKYPYYGATGILDYVHDYIFNEKLILIGEDGAKWGTGENTAFIAEGKYWVNNHAHVIRPDRSIVLDNWIVYFLNVSDLQKYVTGLTVPKLNQEKMRGITLPLPPLPEQKRIVAKLDELSAETKKLEAIYRQKIADLEELKKSILQKAFNGELN